MRIPHVLVFCCHVTSYHQFTTTLQKKCKILQLLWTRHMGMITWAPAQGLTGWNQGFSSGLQFRILFQDHWLLKPSNYLWLYYWSPILWLIVGQELQSVLGSSLKPFPHDLIHKHFTTWAFVSSRPEGRSPSCFKISFQGEPSPF